MQYSFKQYVSALYALVDKTEKKSFYFIFFFMIIASVIEFIGIGSIFPYIAIISNPSVIHRNKYLSVIYRHLRFSSDFNFIIFCGALVFSFIIIKGLITLYNNYIQAKFSSRLCNRISKLLFKSYVEMPYEKISDMNSSHMMKYVLYDVQNASGVLTATLNLLANFLLGISLLILMLFANPFFVLMGFTLLGSLVGASIYFTKNKINTIGKENEKEYKNFYKNTDESFKSIKDIQISKVSNYFIDRFVKTQNTVSHHNVIFSVITNLPNIVINTFGFGIILFITIILFAIYHNIIAFLPIIGVIALSIQRLLPIANILTSSLAVIRRYKVVVFQISERIELLTSHQNRSNNIHENKVMFNDKIELKNITFKYAEKIVLSSLNLTIEYGKIIGIVGSSGSGKSTLVDIILGLRKPFFGEIVSDGILIQASFLNEYIGVVSYVPQKVYMLDGTLEENIIFGRDIHAVDNEKLLQAIHIAQLDDLVSSLSHGRKEILGEDAIKLSGGQRQRIGIARAIYSNPDVLIFDESTSALDTETECNFYEALKKWSNGKKTILIVSHRKTLLNYCDELIIMSEGKVNEQLNLAEGQRAAQLNALLADT